MKQDSPNPPEITISARHELSDVAPRPVTYFVIAFLASLIVVNLIGWGVLKFLGHRQEISDRMKHPEHPLGRLMSSTPPGPLLEPEPSRNILPREDLKAVRAREKLLIGNHAWAWIDSSHRFARIPLHEAMNLAVEHGLPPSLPATQPTTRPLLSPASSVHGTGGAP